VQSEVPDRAIHYLQEAAGLYGGYFLEDFADSEWAIARQEELRRTYQEALLLLGELLHAAGRYAEGTDAYRKAIAHDRFLEEAHRGLMRCQAGMGERSSALSHYDELVALLEEQLCAPPTPETTMLYRELRGDR
jgi:DNA-binding SARP family transcriptional activator